MRLKVISFFTFFFLLIQLTSSGCRLPSSDLSPEEIDIVDTLFNKMLPDIRVELDSVCKLNKDSLVKEKTDSLIELQLIEIKKLINRQ